MQTRQRRPDSVRFDPYYKIQVYERHAWVDIQRRYYDRAAALAARPAGVRSRLMMITEWERAPVPGSDSSGC